MIELIRYLYFLLGISSLTKLTYQYTNVRDMCLGSLICSLVSIIWHPAIYISIIYHLMYILYFFNEKYQIDLRKYRWVLDYMENSSDQYIQIGHHFYRGYFDRIINRIEQNGEGREMVTVGEYVIKLLGWLQCFIIPLTFFNIYTSLSLDTIHILYWIVLLYKATISGRSNLVRFLHSFFFALFLLFDNKWIVYPYICSLSLVSNEIFHFGLPDKLRELFGYKPTRYCKFCKNKLTNNLLEGVLIDHNIIERRTHSDCYCRYVYQCQVRYWFDSIVGIFASLYMAYWLEGVQRVWVLITVVILSYDKIKKYLNFTYSNYLNSLLLAVLIVIVGGFEDPFCSYFLILSILSSVMYKNVTRMM